LEKTGLFSRPERAVLYVDGASRGNPGPAAAGGLIVKAGQILGRLAEPLGIMTNNQAEYEALIRGVALALKLGLKELEIRSDSQLLVRQLQGSYRVKDPKLKLLHAEALAALKLLDDYDIIFIDRSLNQEADGLANQALDGLGQKEADQRRPGGRWP